MPLHGVASLQAAINERVDNMNNSLRAKFLQALSNVAIGTPVDEGRAANNWFLTTTRPSSQTRGKNKSATASITSLNKMPARVIGIKLFYSNNMPYINRLNYTDWAIVPGTRGWVNREMDQLRVAIRNI